MYSIDNMLWSLYISPGNVWNPKEFISNMSTAHKPIDTHQTANHTSIFTNILFVILFIQFDTTNEFTGNFQSHRYNQNTSQTRAMTSYAVMAGLISSYSIKHLLKVKSL